eukprot:CAMPEP_0179042494 /NCGR_PEP_ID=MMETSP0796-20121207/16689_1 /TAXON_ID=73915 /ORGANISM="Pyrodinium bahamense, Strain pbaha01" /LENGTH=402 /DNA_ID=CAMNT_0020738867 /DNA_START=125 /DNA_END=1333 /DNA_ORIENTATION=+
MDNPLLRDVMVNYPDVDATALPWPAGAESWDMKDLDLFVGSGGFLKPKKKRQQEPAQKPEAGTPAPGGPAVAQAIGSPPSKVSAGAAAGSAPDDIASMFEEPGFSTERVALTMPVRVHCEDTAPNGHVRLESLVAFAERIRSLSLKKVMNVSLADLKERKLAILATEYTVEIVGSGFRVLDTLRVDTMPEFPSAPLFPWHIKMYCEDGSLYMQGISGLNLCQISDSGMYSGVDEKAYEEFMGPLRKWSRAGKAMFSKTALRFYSAYDLAGAPFKPSARHQAMYVVRSTDCDMYNVLFQARVPSMMESCHPRHDALAFYVNIRTSVRPGDTLAVHVFTAEDSALFMCLREKVPVLTAFGHYGKMKPICQEAIKCASVRVPLLLKYCTGGVKPPPCDDFDLSSL